MQKNGVIGIPDEEKPFSKSENASYDSQHSKVHNLVAITVALDRGREDRGREG